MIMYQTEECKVTKFNDPLITITINNVTVENRK